MRRFTLILMVVAALVVLLASTGPVMADPKEEAKEAEAVAKDPKADPKVKEEEKKEAEKEKKEEKKEKEMPKSGGISAQTAALGAMGAAALILGGGILARRMR